MSTTKKIWALIGIIAVSLWFVGCNVTKITGKFQCNSVTNNLRIEVETSFGTVQSVRVVKVGETITYSKTPLGEMNSFMKNIKRENFIFKMERFLIVKEGITSLTCYKVKDFKAVSNY